MPGARKLSLSPLTEMFLGKLLPPTWGAIIVTDQAGKGLYIK